MLFSGLRHVSRVGLGLPRCMGHRNLTSLPSHYTLPSGDKIPSVALGVWQAAPNEVGTAVKTALNAGYRHIDGAWIYRNEAEVGKAVWITSKDIEPALDESLAKLGTDYLDLYLIHWPLARKNGQPYDKELTHNPYPTWQKLEEMVEKGKVRNIGVSKLVNLTANPLKIQPAVNQWSKENNLLLEAYSPLGSTSKVGDTLAVPEVKEIAAELGMTPAQVIISWHVQRGSVTPSRVVENFQGFFPSRSLSSKADSNAFKQAATSHKPYPRFNPSKGWGLDFDIFD
ncbi:NADP-dependent oxidoreductase domain-containing protein [Mycena rebaudengoi]|nr:NADP-dependent oxidoreductase domain-containing protein [Mycena rebaudengoi]